MELKRDGVILYYKAIPINCADDFVAVAALDAARIVRVRGTLAHMGTLDFDPDIARQFGHALIDSADAIDAAKKVKHG